MPLKQFLYPLAPDGTRIKARKVAYDVIANEGLPKCSWCHTQPLIPLADFVQHGFTINLVSTAAYCAFCDKGTIVEYEIALDVPDVH